MVLVLILFIGESCQISKLEKVMKDGFGLFCENHPTAFFHKLTNKHLQISNNNTLTL